MHAMHAKNKIDINFYKFKLKFKNSHQGKFIYSKIYIIYYIIPHAYRTIIIIIIREFRKKYPVNVKVQLSIIIIKLFSIILK